MKKAKKMCIYIWIVFFFFLVFNRGWFGNQAAKGFDYFSDEYVIADLTYSSLYPDAPPNYPMYYGALGSDISEYITRYYSNAQIPQEEFLAYFSPVGFQFHVYRALSKAIGTPEKTLSFLYGMNAFLMAITFSLFLHWVKNYSGKTICILIAIITAFFLVHFVCYGRNLYWAAWTFLLPFTAICLMEQKIRSMPKLQKWFALLPFSVVVFLPRFLCSQEFTSTFILAAAVPPFLYWVTKEHRFSQCIKRSFFYMLGGFLSFLTGCIIRLWNIAQFTASKEAVKELFLEKMKLHTSGDMKSILWQSKEGLSIFIADVVSTFLQQPAITILGVTVRYLDIFLFVVLILLACGVVYKYKPLNSNMSRIQRLAIVSLASLVCPLSWFILASFHAYNHQHLAFIVWYLPTMFLCLITILEFVRMIFKAYMKFSGMQNEIGSQSPYTECFLVSKNDHTST